jgi:hypothetical protein
LSAIDSRPFPAPPKLERFAQAEPSISIEFGKGIVADEAIEIPFLVSVE